jgi:trimeric autotransporter adhesin
MKVSWNVTGIRKDLWANAHRIQVEEDKPDKERGYYLYPELYGQPAENGISHLIVPEVEKELLINENKRPKRKLPYRYQ